MKARGISTPRRNPRRERRFLDAAARGESFIAQAEARLAAGNAQYGDRWAGIGIHQHLAELLEEAADLGAWAALADQALDHEAMSEPVRAHLRAVLAVAAHRGAQAHAILAGTLAQLESRR